jgi:hypothetical protein
MSASAGSCREQRNAKVSGHPASSGRYRQVWIGLVVYGPRGRSGRCLALCAVLGEAMGGPVPALRRYYRVILSLSVFSMVTLTGVAAAGTGAHVQGSTWRCRMVVKIHTRNGG